MAHLSREEIAEWDARVPELQKDHAREVLSVAIGEAVMAAERAGLDLQEIAGVVCGEMIIRPGYPQRLAVITDP